MKRVSKLKILTVVVMVMLIVFSARASFAQTITSNQVTSIQNSTGNTANNTSVNNVQTNNTTNNTLVNNVTNTPVNNTVLPDTGAASTTGIFVLMALTSISAIYTFIKVRKYNI
ncbi:MAG: LPXTG cell wall anchor domain-containing protein [Clostridia bacterium]